MPYSIKVDRSRGVVLFEVHGRVVDDDLRSGYAEAGRVAAAVNIAGGIVDFTGVTSDETSVAIIRELADREPILPDPIMRAVVAPQDYVYGRMRMFQMMGEKERQMLRIVRRLEDAYELLGIKEPAFEPFEPGA